uniref:Reverse transcriptase domain-containing protein n=1 Tax=Cannabis sativa TaxID=3483 RepID=A0A803NV61_CANSA
MPSLFVEGSKFNARGRTSGLGEGLLSKEGRGVGFRKIQEWNQDALYNWYWKQVVNKSMMDKQMFVGTRYSIAEGYKMLCSVQQKVTWDREEIKQWLHWGSNSSSLQQLVRVIRRARMSNFKRKRDFSTATMRGALTGMWRLQRGWRFQVLDCKTKTFVFCLNSEGEARFVLSNGPWSPCDGFMMVAAMPEDGLWTSGDLDSLDVLVKAHGIPLELMTDDAAVLLANRVGKYISANKVRKKGVLINSFIRFRSRISIRLPLVPGVSLEGNSKKKHWAFFKYERLPVFCFKCGVIGHLENMCSGRNRVVLVDDGRSVPLFGPWIRDGSRLENGFALLEVEDIQDRVILEKSDGSRPQGMDNGADAASCCPPVDHTPQLDVSNGGDGTPTLDLVSKDLLAGGMEGVPRQRSDTTCSVAYNDYVKIPFPAQHVSHVAKIFQEKLGPVWFGATREGEDIGKLPKLAYHLKKSKMVGPNGIHKKPVFRFSNRDLEPCVGGKRKKSMGEEFTGESTGNDCIAIVDNHRVNDVFGEGSAIDACGNEGEEEEIISPSKKLRLDGESILEGRDALPIMGECNESINSRLLGSSSYNCYCWNGEKCGIEFFVGRGGGPYHAPQVPMKLLSWNCRGLGQARAVSALRGLVVNENLDVLFLMETKVNLSRMNWIWRHLGFVNAIVVEAMGSAGGLCLCWKQGVEIENLSASKAGIMVRFENTLNCPAWIGWFVYGLPIRGDRGAFWDDITLHVLSFNEPWMLMGDLNVMVNQSEKFGGSQVIAVECRSFTEFLLHSGGVDIGCVGNFFTWSNKRQLPDLVKERLDRVIGSTDWLIRFPKAGVKALPIRSSDHAPLVLDLLFDQDNYHKPFRFLDAWARDPTCKEDKLKVIEKALLEVQQRVPSVENSQLEADIILEIEEVTARQSEIWFRKSQELWNRDGDRNTRFFHASTIVRRKQNFIGAISEEGVHWINNWLDIGNYFSKNFKSVYSSSKPVFNQEIFDLLPTTVTDALNDDLIRVPSGGEIRKVVWSMAPLKAPGPDGMPGRFYRAHWNIVGQDVIDTVVEFFRTCEFVKTLNRTFIVLIPKKQDAWKFDDYQPISLCNFAYKVIAKLLANRLRMVLPLIISTFQSAFLPGRWIAENRIIAHEILDSFKKKQGKIGFVGLKVDMSKAYDRLEWSFVDIVFKAFSFGNRFRGLIMKCISSVSFSVLLDGGPLKQFCPSQGLRQGDPLSPFLFIIGSEVLSRLLLREEATGHLHGFKVCPRSPPISHLMYADDTFLFCAAKVDEINVVQECLKKYCDWSGQMLNASKSAIVYSKNTCPEVKALINNILGFRPLSDNDKFLGNPISFSKSITRDFIFVVDKVKSRLEGWRSKLLSQAGRTTLIQSVVASITVYAMSTFLLPQRICDELDKVVRKFWWVGARVDPSCGDERLWCRIFRAKYCKHDESFWSVNLPDAASKVARGILASRDFIRGESCWLVANGRNTDIWHSPWIPWLSWNDYIAAFNPRVQSPRVNLLCNFFNERGELMTEAIAEWFAPRVGNQIGRVELLSNSDKDRLIWRDSIDGSFSISQAYLSRIKPRLGIGSNVWKEIWKAPVHERVKLFLWKVCKDILPCGSCLRTVFGNESHCVLCNDGEDSLPHLFFLCPFARACWFSSPFGIRSERLLFSITLDMVNWILHPSPSVYPGTSGEPSLSQFAAYICFSLWNSRNHVYHNVSSLRPQEVLSKCSKLVLKEFNFYSDAAVRGSWAFVAVVVFNKDRVFVDALTAKVRATSALHAECLALCHAFSLSLKLDCKEANFFTDCLQLVNAVIKFSIPVWNLSNLFFAFVCLS